MVIYKSKDKNTTQDNLTELVDSLIAVFCGKTVVTTNVKEVTHNPKRIQ